MRAGKWRKYLLQIAETYGIESSLLFDKQDIRNLVLELPNRFQSGWRQHLHNRFQQEHAGKGNNSIPEPTAQKTTKSSRHSKKAVHNTVNSNDGDKNAALASNTNTDMSLQDDTQRNIRELIIEYLQRNTAFLDQGACGDLFRLLMNGVESGLFAYVMEYTRGNQSQAAKLLGISRTTLARKLAGLAKREKRWQNDTHTKHNSASKESKQEKADKA